LKTSVWERYKMGKRSFTEPKPRADTGFNPFMETQKILGFAEQSGRQGHDVFTVFVKDGNLDWTVNRHFTKKSPGFIEVINRVNFAAGITNLAWRKLEEKIAREMHRQRKAR